MTLDQALESSLRECVKKCGVEVFAVAIQYIGTSFNLAVLSITVIKREWNLDRPEI